MSSNYRYCLTLSYAYGALVILDAASTAWSLQGRLKTISTDLNLKLIATYDIYIYIYIYIYIIYGHNFPLNAV